MSKQSKPLDIAPSRLFHLLAIFFIGTLFLIISVFTFVKTTQYSWLSSVTYALFYLFAACYYYLSILFLAHYTSKMITHVRNHTRGYLIGAGIIFAIATFIGVGYYYGFKGIIAQVAVIVVGVITKFVSSLISKR